MIPMTTSDHIAALRNALDKIDEQCPHVATEDRFRSWGANVQSDIGDIARAAKAAYDSALAGEQGGDGATEEAVARALWQSAKELGSVHGLPFGDTFEDAAPASKEFALRQARAAIAVLAPTKDQSNG